MSGALVPPAGDAVAAALRRVTGPAEAVREWVPLPAAPEGWVWRAGFLERVAGAKRWTIGRRTAYDGRWQLLVWDGDRARCLHVAPDLAGVIGWLEARRKNPAG